MSKFISISEAITRYKNGEILIIVDDEDRENEGDFVAAANRITPDIINFMAKEGRGLICIGMTGERLDELNLHPMVGKNTAKMKTGFTVSVDAMAGTTTGISAHDRAHTIKVLMDDKTQPEDLARPGHVFPLRAESGGVLCRAGHTEAAVDLARLSGLSPAASKYPAGFARGREATTSPTTLSTCLIASSRAPERASFSACLTPFLTCPANSGDSIVKSSILA